mgnify:CR=1 FL=1
MYKANLCDLNFFKTQIGTEIRGSRQLMESLAINGNHVVKPMLFENSEEHIDQS